MIHAWLIYLRAQLKFTKTFISLYYILISPQFVCYFLIYIRYALSSKINFDVSVVLSYKPNLTVY